MATIAERFSGKASRPDVLSGTPRAHAMTPGISSNSRLPPQRTSAWFIAVVLTGFIPDSIMKVGMVRAGARPPFPLVMHLHALLMGSFLLVLLAQAWLMATGRKAQHMKLGVLGMALAAMHGSHAPVGTG